MRHSSWVLNDIQLHRKLIPAGSLIVSHKGQVDQPGTYWYHSHERGQYPDGFRGQMVVHDPENPYADMYDEEVAITLSDWYHGQMVDLLTTFISVENPTGAEPIPDSALMNDTQNLTVSIKPGNTYFFRMVNLGAFAGQYFWIEGHTMQIIEVDGVYTEPTEASMIYIAAAQRYGFLVTAKNETGANFPMVGSMDTVSALVWWDLEREHKLTTGSPSLTQSQAPSTTTSLAGYSMTHRHHCPQLRWLTSWILLTTSLSCLMTTKSCSRILTIPLFLTSRWTTSVTAPTSELWIIFITPERLQLTYS